jgi:cytochrome c-type biogenesis protein CcmF
MSGPIGLALLFLMAVAPVLPWRNASLETLSQRLLWPAFFGVAVLVACVAAGIRGLIPLVTFGLGAFAAGAAIRQVVLATRRNGWRGFVGRTNGGMIVHLGVVLVAIGLAASGSFAESAEARLAPGETRRVHGHDVTFVRFEERDTDPTRLQQVAVMEVGGRTMEPRLQRFPNATQELGKPAVRYGIGDTVYLALLKAPTEDGGTILVRIIVQPLVGWLWAGGLLMLVGTVLSAFPGRRRRGTDPTSAPAAIEGPSAEPERDPEPDPEPEPVGAA